MTILTRKFNKVFLLEMSYKNSWVKFDAFSMINMVLFSLQNEALSSESVKKNDDDNKGP